MHKNVWYIFQVCTEPYQIPLVKNFLVSYVILNSISYEGFYMVFKQYRIAYEKHIPNLKEYIKIYSRSIPPLIVNSIIDVMIIYTAATVLLTFLPSHLFRSISNYEYKVRI